MPWVTPSVQFDKNLPSDPVRSWSVITPDVESISIKRGRSSELDTFSAGTCTVRLRNDNRQYDPNYTAGPYYGKLEPRHRLRVQATYSGTTYDLFHGFISGWPQDIDYVAERSYVELQCTDAFELFATIPLAKNSWIASVMKGNPAVWLRLNDEAVPSGGTVKDLSGNARDAVIQGTPVSEALGIYPPDQGRVMYFNGVTALWLPQDAPASGSQSIAVEWWQRADPPLPAAGNSWHCWQISNSFIAYVENAFLTPIPGVLKVMLQNGETTTFLEVKTLASVADGQWHHFLYTFDGTEARATLYMDGVLQQSVTRAPYSWNPGSTDTRVIGADMTGRYSPHFNFPGRMHNWVMYSPATERVSTYLAAYGWVGQASGARLGSLLDLASWPAADRVLDAGTDTLAATFELSGSLLDAMQKVAAAEPGWLYVEGDGKLTFRQRTDALTADDMRYSNATFGDGAGELRYLAGTPTQDATYIYNLVTASREGGPDVVMTDQASIAKYWRKGLSRTGILLLDDDAVRMAASGLLARYAKPATRVEQLVTSPLAGTGETVQCLARKLGQRLTFKRKPQNVGNVLTMDGQIEGIEHNINLAGRDWKTTFRLSPSQDYFIFDDPVRGLMDSYPMGY